MPISQNKKEIKDSKKKLLFEELHKFVNDTLATEKYLKFSSLKDFWKTTQIKFGVKTKFHSSRVTTHLLSQLPVVIWKLSKNTEGYIFKAEFDPYEEIIRNSSKPNFISVQQMDFWCMFFEPKPRLLFQYLLFLHLGNVVQKTYRWNLEKCQSNTIFIEKQFREAIAKYFNSVHTPDPAQQWKQLVCTARRIGHEKTHHRGRKPWEIKAPKTAAAIVEFIHHKGTTILPNLENQTHYVGGVSLKSFQGHLAKLKASGEIECAPKARSISSAFQGYNKRGNLPIRFLSSIKCQTRNHPDQELLLNLHQLERDLLFSLSKEGLLPRGSFAIIGIDDLAMIELDVLIFNKKQWSTNSRCAPSTDFQKGRRLIFTSFLFLSLSTLNNKLRENGQLPPLPRYNHSNLPVWDRNQLEALLKERDFDNGPVKIKTSDRSGYLSAVLKPYCKEVDSKKKKKYMSLSLDPQMVSSMLLNFIRCY